MSSYLVTINNISDYFDICRIFHNLIRSGRMDLVAFGLEPKHRIDAPHIQGSIKYKSNRSFCNVKNDLISYSTSVVNSAWV